jgi:ATP-dependent helicase HrpB
LLPVEPILPALHRQLLQGDAIVVAPPGAGKSTCLPLSLLGLAAFRGKTIIMLQPRRLAVRNIAAYLAKQLNETVGQTVGYRIRGETKISKNTRLEIVTEGILTRMLQSDPELQEIGLVIFDEFHERNLHGDFSLALCIEVQQSLREDLRLLVMSATLDVLGVSRLLPLGKVLHCEGRSYPVELRYRPDHAKIALHEKVSRLIINVFAEHQGDFLVFLPGARDINKTAERMQQQFAGQVQIHRLFSELSKVEQQAALLPDPQGHRKIVLATNIAETSLTIEGIEVVIDSGIEKMAVFQLSRGFTHLQSQKISQASAIQRAGRAGRVAAGSCYRLFSSEQYQRFDSQSVPQILQSDLSSFLLECAVWGTDITELALIDQPSAAQLAQGWAYLTQLALVDSHQRLTPLGRQAHGLGCQPGIALMLIKSATLSAQHLSLACALSALFESKDPLGYRQGVDVSARLYLLLQQKNHNLWQTIRQWFKKMSSGLLDWPFADIAVLIGFAYPQWLAQQRQGERYQLANGTGAVLNIDDALCQSPWLAIAVLKTSDHQQDNAQIGYAQALSTSQLEQHFSHLIEQQTQVQWHEKQQKILAYKEKRLGKIVMHTQPMQKPSPENIRSIWRHVFASKGADFLPLSPAAKQLIYRVRLAAILLPDKKWPDYSDGGLLASIEEWLLPHLGKITSAQQLNQSDYFVSLKNTLDYQQQQCLDQFFPERLMLPSGRQGQLLYTEQTEVLLSVRMQELYGLHLHPSIARGHIAVTVELLSPAGRPIQTTQDIPGFWQGSYKAVQKEMKGRYPRHFWPDDPVRSQATTTTKKRMKPSE